MNIAKFRFSARSSWLLSFVLAIAGLLGFLYWDFPHRAFGAVFFVLVCATVCWISLRPAMSAWLALWLLGAVALASQVRMSYLGTPLTYLDLRTVSTAPEIIVNYDGRSASLAVSLLGFILVLGFFETPLLLKRKLRLALAFASVLGVTGLAVAVAKTPLPPFTYAGAYPAGKGAMRILVGSVFDVSSLDAVAKEGQLKFCCARHPVDYLRPSREMGEVQPNLVFVLLESSFDPALTLEYISTGAPALFGARPLHVHTAGGETWSAEYAILHGLPHPIYGPSGIHVNLLGPGTLEGALPRILKLAGYTTSTVSSTDGGFYGQARFHASLGVDRFEECSSSELCKGLKWTQVSDQQAYERVLDLLHEAPTVPKFVFTNTVRQHSPHFPRNLVAAAMKKDPEGLRLAVLKEFSKRQAMSMAELAWFVDELKKLNRPTVLVAFGDHIPSDVNRYFESTHFTDKFRTHYTVFDTRTGSVTSSLESQLRVTRDMDVAYLDVLALRVLGLQTAYGRDKMDFLQEHFGEFPVPLFLK